MDFGLGLILSFTDNATTGINSAVNSLNNLTSVAESASSSLNSLSSTAELSALSVISGQLGSSFTNMGSTIISTFSEVIGKINETGTTMMYAENQLSKLYENSSKTGKDVLNDISNYAKQSIFNFEDLIPVVTMLKANGIEAFDSIASSTGKSDQLLMDYAADLAAFNPQMKNAYGTGIKAAMGALNEYIAEGNARSLKAGASLDITGLLGEEKGATIEERSRQVADLMEKLNMVGMTATMAGTPMQRLANIQDVLFQTVSKIADSGVYDEFSAIIQQVSDYIFAIPEEELTNIASVIGDALVAVMKPLEKVVGLILKLADGFRKVVKENPKLAKFATILTAIAGVVLLVAGVALKAISSLSGLCIVMQTFGGSFSKIITVVRSGLLKVIATIAPLALAMTALYVAWRSDFGGIRTMTTSLVTNLMNSWTTARNAVNGSVSDMVKTLEALRAKNDFFSNLTIGLMKVMIVAKALSEAWNDYTLSEDTYEKARELGVLPLIEAILDLKYRFDFFKQGFIDGWHEIGEKVKEFVSGLADNLDGTIFQGLIDGVTNFLQLLASGDPDAWYEFGKSFAEFTAKAIAFAIALKGIDKALGFISKIATIIGGISKIGGVFGKVFSGIWKVFSKIFPWIAQIGKGIVEVVQLVASGAGTVAEALQAVFSPLAGVVAVIAGAVTAVLSFVSMWQKGFSVVKEIVMLIGIALATVGAIILGVAALPAVIVGAIIAAVATLAIVIHDHWTQICEFFSSVGSWIYDNVIKPVCDFFVGLGTAIANVVMGIVNAITSFFSTIASWIYNNVIAPIVNFVTTYIVPIVSKIIEIVAKIIEIIVVLVTVFVQWIYNNVITPIINFFVGLWNTIVTGVQSFITTVQGVVSSIVTWIDSNIIQPIVGFFTSLWTTISGIVSGIVTSIQTFFGTIASWIDSNVIQPVVGFFQGLWDSVVTIFTSIATTISDAISGVIKSTINTVLGFVTGVINTVISAINGAISIINKIPGVSITKITELSLPALAKGGVVDNPTVAMIGEAGKEAVVPLENNTQWITGLASQIVTALQQTQMTPSNTLQQTPVGGDQGGNYMTNNTNNTTTQEGDTDNSITFAQGSIVIQCNKASDEEAERMAIMIMQYIKRQKEIEAMTNYA